MKNASPPSAAVWAPHQVFQAWQAQVEILDLMPDPDFDAVVLAELPTIPATLKRSINVHF